jgi:ATP-dependent RNA helicase HelY
VTATTEFELDPFQRRAVAAIDAGDSVLVAAPTGAGKTVVAEHAVAAALAGGGKAFYTTPIKALSNQKFADLARRHGAERVGLLTGDNSINGDAPVVVMTTEVLRNMIYARSSALDGLQFVVLDEVHYLQDTYRGPVWEEVIIHLAPEVRLVCLSATVSNADEVAEWLTTVRGQTTLVLEEERPVELRHLYLAGDRQSEQPHLLPILVDGRPNPEAGRLDNDLVRGRGPRRGQRRPRKRFFTPRRVDVIAQLDDREMLPALYFIFSRAACDEAVQQCLDAGCGSPRPTSGCASARSSPSGPARSPTTTSTSCASSAGPPPSRRAWPPTTPAWSRRSRRRSRPASWRAWSRPCSPPRRWRSGSTCRPARSSSSG